MVGFGYYYHYMAFKEDREWTDLVKVVMGFGWTVLYIFWIEKGIFRDPEEAKDIGAIAERILVGGTLASMTFHVYTQILRCRSRADIRRDFASILRKVMRRK